MKQRPHLRRSKRGRKFRAGRGVRRAYVGQQIYMPRKSSAELLEEHRARQFRALKSQYPEMPIPELFYKQYGKSIYTLPPKQVKAYFTDPSELELKAFGSYPQKIHLLSKELEKEGPLGRQFKAAEIKQTKEEWRKKIREAER